MITGIGEQLQCKGHTVWQGHNDINVNCNMFYSVINFFLNVPILYLFEKVREENDNWLMLAIFNETISNVYCSEKNVNLQGRSIFFLS